MTDGNKPAGAISEDDLLEDYFDSLHAAYAEMNRVFSIRSSEGLSQDDIAASLRIDKALVSKRLNGRDNLTWKTLSYMATALRCRLRVAFEKHEDIVPGNHYSQFNNIPPVQGPDSWFSSSAETNAPNIIMQSRAPI